MISAEERYNKAEEKADAILKSLSGLGYEITPIGKKEYNLEFEVKENGGKVKVLVFFGKKGIKTIVQGNKESELYKIVDEVATGNFTLDFPEEQIDEPSNYIGSDETGKGDFFGPLVTCAVYVNEKLISELRKLGVRDSKELSESQIRSIANNLKKIGSDYYEIISIEPKRYNELYDKIKNINEILNWSHSKAIENLSSKFHTGTIITDKFRLKEMKFSKTFDQSKYELIQIPKAEKYTAVAAASILARRKQLEWFDNNKPGGVKLPKGASDIVKDAANIIVEKNGFDDLKNYVKMHFKTVKNL